MVTTKDNTTLVSRPRRKPDSSVRGKLNRWEGSDYCEFVPSGTRESNRKKLSSSATLRSTKARAKRKAAGRCT